VDLLDVAALDQIPQRGHEIRSLFGRKAIPMSRERSSRQLLEVEKASHDPAHLAPLGVGLGRPGRRPARKQLLERAVRLLSSAMGLDEALGSPAVAWLGAGPPCLGSAAAGVVVGTSKARTTMALRALERTGKTRYFME